MRKIRKSTMVSDATVSVRLPSLSASTGVFQRLMLAIVLVSAWCMFSPATAEQVVTRDMADTTVIPWSVDGWSRASGILRPDPEGGVELRVDYSGQGFEFWRAGPDVVIPGVSRSVRVRYQGDEGRTGWALSLKDAQGRDSVGNRKLEVSLPVRSPGQWEETTFEIPDDWEQPLKLTGVLASNWGRRNETDPYSSVLRIGAINVETDVTNAGTTADLVAVRLTSQAPSNLFVADEPIEFVLAVDSWVASGLEGRLDFEALDSEGNKLVADSSAVRIDGAWTAKVAIPMERFGPGSISLLLDLGDEPRFERSARFARIPERHALDAEARLRSPYGINVHGGSSESVAFQALASLGIDWVRDYAYTLSWLRRARGEDGRYQGWPGYTRLAREREAAGLMLLPAMSGAIRETLRDGHDSPPQDWVYDIAHALWAFRDHKCWQLDNEFDLAYRARPLSSWRPIYDAYHRRFAELLRGVNPDVWVVENGTAGVHPELVRASIASGAFRDVDVVAAHFYSGTEPAETAVRNTNTGQENAPRQALWDLLREYVAAAGSDGRERQSWITEFGWDTLAVHIVSEHQQAAYLQRGFAMGLQAGLDKMFWYWDRDTRNPEPKTFFDGCGLLDLRDEAKPAAAAFAALTHLLPAPEPIGVFHVAPNAMGYLFRSGGRSVAAVFQVRPDGPQVSIETPPGAECRDLYGNTVEGGRHTLDVAPLWVMDVPDDHPWTRDADVSIVSRVYLRLAAGDTTSVRFRLDNRAASERRLALRLADDGAGVLDAPSTGQLVAAPGECVEAELTLSLRSDAPMGRHGLRVETEDVDGRVVRLPLDVEIVPPAILSVRDVDPSADPPRLSFRIRNNRSLRTAANLRVEPPEVARLDRTEIRMAPDESQDVSADLLFQSSANEPGWLIAHDENGVEIGRAALPLLEHQLPRLSQKPRFDGYLADWPETAFLPSWALSATMPNASARVALAWSEEGLFVAAEVSGSRLFVPDARQFWVGDVLELLLDTRADRSVRDRFAPTDHQLWLCPQIDAGEVYVGRWKRHEEIGATQYGLSGVEGFARRTDEGYIIEAFIPSDALTGFEPEAGARIGLGFSLSIATREGATEVYWPRSKEEGLIHSPPRWAAGVLMP